jgi:ring-1,2-phenylacetyl-CoA epoxidase subunit PaaA
LKQGHDNTVYLATGTPQQREMVQDALNRWWRPVIHFFGPPDSQSVHSEKLIKWKIKMMTNDEMRNQFFSMYVPKIEELGLTLPDADLKKNDDGTWNYSDPDWDEFWAVVKGNGPCNKERIAVRRMAEERGRWVREALQNKESVYVSPLA